MFCQYVSTKILADLLHEISFSWATISAIWANITASSMSLCKSGFSNSIQLYWTIKKPRDRCHQLRSLSKLYIPSTLNIDLILWHTQLCLQKMLNHSLNPFTFQAYILPHTLNCMCVSLFKSHIWILEQF